MIAMYPVGHVTLACGLVWGASRLLERRHPPEPDVSTEQSESKTRGRAIDYRWAALGALLPDLIDKPVTWSGLAGSHSGGHFVGHALIVPAAIVLIALPFARTGRYGLLLFGLAALSHILADSVTHVPRSLLWPFVTLPVSHNPTLVGATNIAGETIGSIVVLYVLFRLYREHRLDRLMRQGAF